MDKWKESLLICNPSQVKDRGKKNIGVSKMDTAGKKTLLHTNLMTRKKNFVDSQWTWLKLYYSWP